MNTHHEHMKVEQGSQQRKERERTGMQENPEQAVPREPEEAMSWMRFNVSSTQV